MQKIRSLDDLRRFIAWDLRSSSKSCSVRSLITDPVLRFTLVLRFNEYLLNNKINIIARLIPLLYFRRLSIRLGFSIPFNVFGEGLAIVHYGTIIVNPAASIGRNCRIHAVVNIGGSSRLASPDGAEHSAPTIGDNVYIGPGAKIYGPITIANGCVIGANAVVGRTFAEKNKTIAGVPAKVVASRGSDGMLIDGGEVSIERRRVEN